MLELGKPLHSYDLGLVKGSIKPRFGKNGEKLTLLDGKDVEIEEGTLVISDDSGVLGLAGIMGGVYAHPDTMIGDLDDTFQGMEWKAVPSCSGDICRECSK